MQGRVLYARETTMQDGMRMAEDKDVLLLQAKEVNASVLEVYTRPSVFAHHGQRVVIGQRLMQSASELFLGWMSGVDGRLYTVGQLRDLSRFALAYADQNEQDYAALVKAVKSGRLQATIESRT